MCAPPAWGRRALLAGLALATGASALVTITANVNDPLPYKVPAWGYITMWAYDLFTEPIGSPTLQQYPFINTIELFTATGGCYIGFPGCTSNRDLLVDPSDPHSDFDFSPLLRAVGNISASGLRPYIVTGNVPIAYSATPTIGGFGFNSAAPANFSQYGAYIAGLAQALVAAFGLDAVRGFQWGVLTEYNNLDWYNNSLASFAALYDHTACALEGVLGAGNVYIGAHACPQCGGGAWDSLRFLDHVVTGPNYCTGAARSPLSFLGLSFYEQRPGVPGDLSTFAADVLAPVAYARALPGLGDIAFGIDEGRLLVGLDGENLATRAVGATYQASWDALFFKLLATGGLSWYSRWGTTTAGSTGLYSWRGDVDPVSTQVAQLAHRMLGEALLRTANTSSEAPTASKSSAAGADSGPAVATAARAAIVDAVVSYDAARGSLHALVFRHDPAANDTADADVANVTVCGLPPQPAAAAAVTGSMWRIDAAHAQFWPTWQADAAAHNISSYTPGWSPSGEAVQLTSAAERAYFASRVPAYQALAALAAEPAPSFSLAGGCLSVEVTLTGHAVTLLEWAGL